MVGSFVFALVGDWMAIWLDEKLVLRCVTGWLLCSVLGGGLVG